MHIGPTRGSEIPTDDSMNNKSGNILHDKSGWHEQDKTRYGLDTNE